MSNKKWIRTCQECGNKQVTKPPKQGEEPTVSYCNSKCRKCKSEALDYGSYESTEEDLKEWLEDEKLE